MRNSQITGIGSNMPVQSSGFDVVKRQEEAAEVMFADMISMNSSVDVNASAGNAADEMVTAAETEKLDTHREKPADAYEKYQYKDKTIRKETSDSKPEQAEGAVAEVKEFEEAVTEVIAEELNVSKEELEAAMEELGLTYLDLLDNSNLAQLVMKLTGEENANLLLCSEAFMNVLKQVKGLGTELLDKVQMTPEELSEVLEMAEGVANQETELLDAAEVTKETTEEVAEVIYSVSEETDAEVTDVKVTDVKVTAEATQEVDDAAKVEVVRVEADSEEQMDSSEESLSDSDGQNDAETNLKQSSQIQTVQAHETVVLDGTKTVTFTEQLNGFETAQPLPTYVTVSDIMEQFAEQTKILLSEDTTKIEMQLNPEHLGKLHVEVIENEGSITAKIQTQNTIVKEALEMQIADLKMNLNQTGVKVDSVEVTVASHEFERNLEQDANSQKQQEDAKASTTRHRNINLNGLDELSGLMTEEEALVAKMMAEQGNSVDFTA